MKIKKFWVSFLIVVLLCAVPAPLVFGTAAAPNLKVFEVTDAAGNPKQTPLVWATGNVVKPESYLQDTFYFRLTNEVASVYVVSIDIVTSTDLSVFPFEVAQTNYYKAVGQDVVSGGSIRYDFYMRCRGDAAQNYYQIPFKIEYMTGGVTEIAIVNVDVLVKSVQESGGGDVSNIPKVIVSSFSTNPSSVVAGETFTLSVTFRNTAANASPTNIKAQISSDVFTPVSGSTTLFMDSIPPGGSVTKSIVLKAKSDAAPGSYSATFALNYDVAGLTEPVVDTEIISIPLIQVPRVQISAMQIYPTEVFVGNEVNIMANINNTGKSKLYNVNVRFGDVNGIINPNEQFIGNVEPGSTGAVDIYLGTTMTGEAQIEMTVTYEDETGKQYTHTENASVFVMDRANSVPFPTPEDPGGVKPVGGFSLWWLLLIPLIAGIVVMVILLSRRKRKSNNKFKAGGDHRRNGVAEREYLQKIAAEKSADPAQNEQEPPQ